MFRNFPSISSILDFFSFDFLKLREADKTDQSKKQSPDSYKLTSTTPAWAKVDYTKLPVGLFIAACTTLKPDDSVTVNCEESGGGYDTIQEAIDAVVAYGSGEVSVCSGTYEESLIYTSPYSVRLISADGPGSAIISGNGERPITVKAGILSIYNFEIEDGNSSEDGGAILVESDSQINIENTNITNNTAEGNGGAIAVQSGGKAVIYGGTIAYNSAQNGGAFYINGVDGLIFLDNYDDTEGYTTDDILIYSNSANEKGPTTYVSEGSFEITDETTDYLIAISDDLSDADYGIYTAKNGAVRIKRPVMDVDGSVATLGLNLAEEGSTFYYTGDSSPTVFSVYIASNETSYEVTGEDGVGYCSYDDGECVKW